jgi:uncharacterized alpha-E superfamily protein
MRLVLELCDSTITYRRRYPTDHYSLLALTVILSDATNPRALNYQLHSIGSSLGALVGYGQLGRERAVVGELIKAIDTLCLHLDDEPEPTVLTYAHHRETIRAALDQTRGGLMNVSETLSRNFLAHIDPVQSLYPGAMMQGQDGTP